MNKEILTAGGIDYDRALARFMNNTQMYESFLKSFASDTCMERSRAALEKKDYPGLLSATHELKGVSGNLEFTEVYKYASEIVALIRKEDYEMVPQSFSKLEQAYEHTLGVIASAT